MNNEERIAAAKAATEKLQRLLADPHPGLHTWQLAVAQVKGQLDEALG
jgi:hypothetical protein